MILSGQSIMQRGIFTPFCNKSHQRGMSYGLSAAGYDVRISLGEHPDTKRYRDGQPGRIQIEPGGFILASTLEHFTMDNDLIGIVHDKSTWARQGIALQNTVIEPGWRGYLTLEITNHSDQPVTIYHGDPIAQILLHLTDQSVAEPYDGKYQDQASGPQEARFENGNS